MYDRGTEGPHRGPKPHCAKRCTNTEQRDDPYPKELTSKHKMEKSHYWQINDNLSEQPFLLGVSCAEK